jgi:hypothetical protein
MTGFMYFKCTKCGDTWETHDEAIRCCFMSPVMVWMCEACDKEFDNSEEAFECCPEAIAEELRKDEEALILFVAANPGFTLRRLPTGEIA